MLIGNRWDAVITLVTPRMAEEYLSMNSNNRRPRAAVVAKYASTMNAGSWMLTPEAICFSDDGVLLNGQHRLMAVVKCGIPQEFLIISGVNREVFKALDRGAVRSVSDALGIDKKLSEASKLFAGVALGHPRIIDEDVAFAAEIIRDEHDAIYAACPSTAKVFSTAPIRLAACIRMILDKDPEYIVSMYKNMVMAKVVDLPPVAQSFCTAVFAGRITTGARDAQYDLLARGLKLFDKENQEMTRIQINDLNSALSIVKKLYSGDCK